MNRAGLSFLLLFLACSSGGGGEGGGGTAAVPACSIVGSPLFTALPLDAADFDLIVPLGNLNPSSHTFPTDHHYLRLVDPNVTVPVRAPGKIWITHVSKSENLTAGTTDYSMTFSVCQEVSGTFMHLHSFSAGVLAKIGSFDGSHSQTYTTGGNTYRLSQKTVSAPVEAGIVIAYVGAVPGQPMLDFGVYDGRVSQTFANPQRLVGDYRNAISCLDYFGAANRSLLEGRCGGWSGTLRTAPPIGGTVAQDVPGTAQGLWFKPGAPNSPEDPHLALVHDNVDPSRPVFSVGTSLAGLGLASGTYDYAPQSTGLSNRDFGAIIPDGNIYDFSGLGGAAGASDVIILKLLDADTLRIEKQSSSSGPPWVFTASAVDFTR